MEQPSIFILNSEKTEKRWLPYLPFVNSIRDINALYDFVIGKMTLLVLVDTAYLCKQLATAMPGWNVSMIEHPTMLILFEHDGGANFAASRQIYGRLGFEFMSLEWFIDHHKTAIPSNLSNLEKFEGAIIKMEDFEALENEFKTAPPYFG